MGDYLTESIKKRLNEIKYTVCCPLCDNKTCQKGTVNCEAELWVARTIRECEAKNALNEAATKMTNDMTEARTESLVELMKKVCLKK